ncbi:Myc-type [Hirschfeldia incana]|nr:Myc-type [Hirschfeldia incana]
MDISCNSEFNQLEYHQMMTNFPTPEELNDILYLPSLQTMEPQLYSHQSPAVTTWNTEAAQQLKHTSYMNTTTNQCSSGFGEYGVIGNLQPKKESTLLAHRNVSRGVSQARDHIIAERRRREKLSQRFIALSTIVPGLKKTDKASVLGGTIKYLKHLQDRVRFLEEQASQRTIDSVVFLNKSRLSVADTELECTALPEIEARSSGKSVLIRVHCERRKGVVKITMAEIEKLNLTVINSSVITFGSNSIHITIISQMGEGFNITTKDVATSIKSSLEAFTNANLI